MAGSEVGHEELSAPNLQIYLGAPLVINEVQESELPSTLNGIVIDGNTHDIKRNVFSMTTYTGVTDYYFRFRNKLFMIKNISGISNQALNYLQGLLKESDAKLFYYYPQIES